MTHEEVIPVVEDIDTYFNDIILKYKIPSNLLIGVVMARLTLMAELTGKDEFLLLLERAKSHIISDMKTTETIH
jgi:hypothetical protein